MTSTVHKLNEEIYSTLDLPSQESLFESPKLAEQNEKIKKLQKQSNDLATLMLQLKEKMESSSITWKEKIKILSLKPESWAINQTTKYFGVSKYMVRKAMILKKTKAFFHQLTK